jgi:hypothetical protein
LDKFETLTHQFAFPFFSNETFRQAQEEWLEPFHVFPEHIECRVLKCPACACKRSDGSTIIIDRAPCPGVYDFVDNGKYVKENFCGQV